MTASSSQTVDGARETDAGRAVIVGGTGFVGSAITRALHDRGWQTTVVSRSPDTVRHRFPERAVGAREGDVTRPETLLPALAGAELVVQCAQFPGSPVEDPGRGLTFMDVDARGTIAVVQAARATRDVRKLVYLSGVGADPDAPEHWFRAKAIAEGAVSDSGLEWTVIRPSWVYGPADVSLNRFARAIRWVPLVFPQLGDGRQRINPVFVEDVAELVARVAPEGAASRCTLEVGGPEVLSMDEIVRTTMRVLGREKPILHVPQALIRPFAAFLEVLPGQAFSRDALDFIAQSAIADLSAVDELFPDFTPSPLYPALSSYL